MPCGLCDVFRACAPSLLLTAAPVGACEHGEKVLGAQLETVFRDKKNAGDRPGLGGQEGCGALLRGWSAAVGVMRGFLCEHGHTTR